jgi:pimeloyl-ACP methyl ester carboxylesterase
VPHGWPHQSSPRLTIEGIAQDAVRILDHAGVDRAVLCGHSMGVQVALETWHLHPDRVAGLILVCGSYGRPLGTFHGRNLAEKALPYVERLFRKKPHVTRFLWRKLLNSELAYQVAIRGGEVNGRLVKRDDFLPYFRHISQVDPLLFMEMLSHAAEHTSERYLKDIDVPTLVVAGDADTFTPPHLSQKMQHLVPGSELLVVPSGSHTAPIEIPELIGLRIEKFLKTRLGQRHVDRNVNAVRARAV